MSGRLNPDAYTIAWIATEPIEAEAVLGMLDKRHAGYFETVPGEQDYGFLGGEINGHNIVIATWPEYIDHRTFGVAASSTKQIKARFKNVWLALQVGIGMGLPNLTPLHSSQYRDIRIGDVLIYMPENAGTDDILYDPGEAISNIQIAQDETHQKDRDFVRLVEEFLLADEDEIFNRPNPNPGQQRTTTTDQLARDEAAPTRVWHGNIYPSYSVGKYFVTNDDSELRNIFNIVGREVEPTGIIKALPTVAIRGVYNYWHGTRDKDWQPYAAAVAAAYAKGLLLAINPQDVGAHPEPTYRPLYYLPFARNAGFVGRARELETITQKLFVARGCQRLAMHGSCGIGKTELALEFAYTIQSTLPNVSIFWASALSVESFEHAYKEIAQTLHIAEAFDDREELLDGVRQHLNAEKSGRWLLIVDDADDMDVVFGSASRGFRGLDYYLPKSENGSILVITPESDIADRLAGNNVINLEALRQEDAFTLLENSLVRKDLLHDRAIITNLLNELSYTTEAITQAAAYLNMNEITIAAYLELLRGIDQERIDLIGEDLTNHASCRTWLVSYDRILKDDSIETEPISFVSCIKRKAIPRSLLPPLLETGERKMTWLDTLLKYKLVVRRGVNEEIYDLCQPVHSSYRIWAKQKGLSSKIQDRTIKHFAEIFSSKDFEYGDEWKEYMPHALTLIETTTSERSTDGYELCFAVGLCLGGGGKWREAVRWFAEAFQWAENNLPEADEDRLDVQLILATAYHQNEQHSEAAKLLEHIVTIEEQKLPEDNSYRLATQFDLAMVYHEQGQLVKAITMLEHVMLLQEKTLPEGGSDLVRTQYSLAEMYKDDKQLAKAINLFERAVKTVEKTLAEDNSHRLRVQSFLVSAYRDAGKIFSARSLLADMIKAAVKTLPEEDPRLREMWTEQAKLSKLDGIPTRQIKRLQLVVALEKKFLTEDNTTLLLSQHNLAVAYWRDGQLKRARQLLRHVDKVEARILKEEDNPERLGDWQRRYPSCRCFERLCKEMEIGKVDTVVPMEAETFSDCKLISHSDAEDSTADEREEVISLSEASFVE